MVAVDTIFTDNSFSVSAGMMGNKTVANKLLTLHPPLASTESVVRMD